MCSHNQGQHDAAYLRFDTSFRKFTVVPKNSPHPIFEFFNSIGRLLKYEVSYQRGFLYIAHRPLLVLPAFQ